MDASMITDLISTVGFPIVACGALFYMNWKQSERHKEETDKFTEALNKNTLVIQQLVDKLDKE